MKRRMEKKIDLKIPELGAIKDKLESNRIVELKYVNIEQTKSGN